MSPLSFKDLRAVNVPRCEEVFHKLDDWSPTDWATAMAGECGEACNEIKKLRCLDGSDSNPYFPEGRKAITERIAIELADLVICTDLLAARLEIDLGEAVADKFNRVSLKLGSTYFLLEKGGSL